MVMVDDDNFDSSNWTLSCLRSAATSCANVTIKSKSKHYLWSNVYQHGHDQFIMWVSWSKVSNFEGKCLVLVRGRWRCDWTLLQIKFHRHRQLSLSCHIVVNIIDDQGVGNSCDGLPGGDHSAGLVLSHPSLRIHCQGIIIIMAYRRLGIFPPDKIPTWWDFVSSDLRVTGIFQWI